MDKRAASAGAASATMRAVVVTQPGGLDALQVTTVPMPEPQPGWVLIKKAFGVNKSEVTTRKGESDPEVTYPHILGIEGVGVLDQADEGSGLRPGQQVATMLGGMGRSLDGSYAQNVTAPAERSSRSKSTSRGKWPARCRRCSRPPTAPSPRASVCRRCRRC
ncbi:alcohol dehydrogenase catalytic domain-containing protein [Streptomyces resistomycificus]|uniref:alcohol dehydrogenase catalytic domain-containing protein n=1 Tax=Streptomyces resistomycificus TaxID=67356 RepID=UPI000B200BBB|nr:alcohol dehydrogenase catalytic domain-containing protein [Streptomyces resistomycificus]